MPPYTACLLYTSRPSPIFSFHLQGLDGIQAKDFDGGVVALNTGKRQFTISGTLAAPLNSDEYVLSLIHI